MWFGPTFDQSEFTLRKWCFQSFNHLKNVNAALHRYRRLNDPHSTRTPITFHLFLTPRFPPLSSQSPGRLRACPSVIYVRSYRLTLLVKGFKVTRVFSCPPFPVLYHRKSTVGDWMDRRIRMATFTHCCYITCYCCYYCYCTTLNHRV